MKIYDSQHIKNITLLGHAGSGKTTFVESMLFEAGEINRLGTIMGQNTVSDYHDLEKEKGSSVFSTLLHLPWKESKINVIDTPGTSDFVGEVISALRITGTGVMLLNAQHGVEVGTEIIWEYTEDFKTPMIFVVNQLDHEKADFDLTVEQAVNRFGRNVLVVQYPLNQGNDFNAIIDVLKMVMYQYPADGGKPQKLPIPDSEIARADELHKQLVESVAEHDDQLMELYFDKGELTEEEMTRGLKAAMLHHDLFPLFCCSATKNMGSGRIMGFLNDIAPAPIDTPPVERQSGKQLLCDPKGPTVLFIYKTISEPHLGDMSFFKVYSGVVNVGDELVNSITGTTERFNQLFLMNGKNRDAINELRAGDIGATVKLKDSHTNSTLHPKGNEFHIKPIDFPEPHIRVAVTTPNKSDVEKMANALHSLVEEDPSLIVEHSQELKQTILHGQGEIHLNVAKWKVEHNYKIQLDFDPPRIPYRETIQHEAKTVYRHKKQSGGAGQFAELHMLIEPYYDDMPPTPHVNLRHTDVHELPWGGKMVFQNCIVGGAIDTRFMGAITKGIMEKMENGPITGSYVRDIRVSIFDGKMHDVDSNDMAFKIASMMAFKDAFRKANPQILEPVYHVDILTTNDYMGDVMSDLQTRRGIIEGIMPDGHYQKISAKVPLSEMHDYSSTLRSIAHGRAKFSLHFDNYAIVPYNVQQELVAKMKDDDDESH
ncbi:MAG: elongation factor G [Chitinophagales bacterium]|nr:elongation factor G [Bacteroidota bacterium]MCB9042584.1 elongation factor G [Chitinophagales bacterium]